MIAFAIMITIFFLCIMCLIIYLGGSEHTKAPEKVSNNKTSETGEPKKDNPDLAVIKQEAALVQRVRELASLKVKLSELEKERNNFELLKNGAGIILCVSRNETKLLYGLTKFTLHLYSSNLKNSKTSKSIFIRDLHEQIFTNEEYRALCALNNSKLNKGTEVYNIVMSRVDAYYQIQIEAINKKIKNN